MSINKWDGRRDKLTRAPTCNAPIVIAKGGFSGLFPSSGSYAYQTALHTSLPNVVLWCDVQLTKDGVGICVPNILLNNCTSIPYVYPKFQKSYLVNGVLLKGWFSKDFTFTQLQKVPLTQGIYSRTPQFDNVEAINAVSDVTQLKPPGLWLNIQNLTFIKTFASGILVPKNYIWPVSPTVYLESPTSIVKDAHKAGLEIYASDFANDVVFAYNYSYDPVAEYLSFVDNPGFSVDGVLTDFPVTASEAIENPLVITHNGASGMYPGCTDLAYKQAVDDKVDIIDCNVQITSDKVPICLSSIDLIQGTTVTQVPPFTSRTSTIPQIQDTAGIFTFNLTWEEIQKLRPEISNPELEYRLVRNPAYKNAGSFWKLSDFLAFAKDKPIKGVMLIIENAIYLTKKLVKNNPNKCLHHPLNVVLSAKTRLQEKRKLARVDHKSSSTEVNIVCPY
ncbi:putative glycerophosphoryl diester phosphodiesterase 3 [Acorus gramineus]|uniref:glycerophosphodiester phosphodiesterase n=1 Tax=Acorus gramineus TaxID=55184 RepID=A0AAV9B1B6_ACOGR|nr:putative glycerophosphoryl diester phosphodiesterase 3 [Acorus gramineus]